MNERQSLLYRYARACLTASLPLACGLVGACAYDDSNPCGDDLEVYGDNVRCVCPEGSIFTPEGCVECGKNEMVSGSACVCEEGFSRPSADESCEKAPTRLGSECDPSDDSACDDPYPHCEPAESSGYCTTDDCESDDDCEDGYTCNDDSVCERPMETEPPVPWGTECDPSDSICEAPYAHCEPAGSSGYCTINDCESSEDCEEDYACNANSVCQRPPSGLGTACTVPEDCEGNEASYCDPFVMSCQVQGCNLDNDDCFVGYECCDLSTVGVAEPLCIPEGYCML